MDQDEIRDDGKAMRALARLLAQVIPHGEVYAGATADGEMLKAVMPELHEAVLAHHVQNQWGARHTARTNRMRQLQGDQANVNGDALRRWDAAYGEELRQLMKDDAADPAPHAA